MTCVSLHLENMMDLLVPILNTNWRWSKKAISKKPGFHYITLWNNIYVLEIYSEITSFNEFSISATQTVQCTTPEKVDKQLPLKKRSLQMSRKITDEQPSRRSVPAAQRKGKGKTGELIDIVKINQDFQY